MTESPRSRPRTPLPNPRAVFSLSIALAIALSGGAVLAYGQWVDARTPMPKAERADVGGPAVWAGHEHQFVAALWVQEGGNGSLAFPDPPFFEMPPGTYAFDPETGSLTFAPDAPLPRTWWAAFLVREAEDPEAKARLFLLQYQGNREIRVLQGEDAGDGREILLRLYASATPTFLTLETLHVSPALADAEDCRAHWQYAFGDGAQTDLDLSPNGSSRLKPLTWRITGDDKIRLTFGGDAPGCPDLRFRVEHLGLQERPK